MNHLRWRITVLISFPIAVAGFSCHNADAAYFSEIGLSSSKQPIESLQEAKSHFQNDDNESRRLVVSQQSAFRGQRRFTNPQIQGLPVDQCLNFAKGCGEPAASAYCRLQGFSSATDWTIESTNTTLILGDQTMCRVGSNSGNCERLSTVICQKNPVPSNTQPNTQVIAGIPISGRRVAELDAFDSAVTEFMQQRSIKALTLAISRKGRVVFSRGYGYGDPQLRTIVSPDALMRVASVDKPITNAAINQLIRQSKLTQILHHSETGVAKRPEM